MTCSITSWLNSFVRVLVRFGTEHTDVYTTNHVLDSIQFIQSCLVHIDDFMCAQRCPSRLFGLAGVPVELVCRVVAAETVSAPRERVEALGVKNDIGSPFPVSTFLFLCWKPVPKRAELVEILCETTNREPCSSNETRDRALLFKTENKRV